MMEWQCPASSWVWLFIFDAVVGTAIVARLSVHVRYSRAVRWLQGFVAAHVLISLASAGFGCITDPGVYTLLVNVRNLLSFVMLPIMIVFAIHYINRSEWLGRWWTVLPLWAIPLGMITALMNGQIYSADPADAQWVTWGYWVFPSLSDAYLGSIYYGAGLLIPVILVLWYHLRVGRTEKRRETRLMLTAFGLPIVGGILGEIALPYITHQPAFPISNLLIVLSSGIITYALTKYGLRVFNPNDVVDEITRIMPNGLLVLDSSLTVQYANAVAEDLLGKRGHTLTGRPLREVLGDKEAFAGLDAQVLQRLEHHGSVTLPGLQLNRPGKPALWLAINAMQIVRGGLTNTIIITTDITALKAAEAALESEKHSVERKVTERTRELAAAKAQLLASIHAMPFGFALIDTRDKLLFSNQQLVTLLSTATNSPGSDPASLFAATRVKASNSTSLLHLARKAQHRRKPIEYQAEIGPHFYRFVFSPAVRETGEDVFGCAVLVEDQTDAKAQERSRDEFFSIASHELRTPLSTLRGNTELMLDYFPAVKQDNELAEIVNDMHDASIRLIAIVNDFLDMSRLEQGRISYKLQPVDVTQLAQQVVREFDVTMSRRHLSLEALPPEPGNQEIIATADPNRTRQILINLIGNGLKYTEKGGISIQTIADRPHGIARFIVRDTGKGIPVSAQHLLFRKFQQATENILTRDSTRSTGLGLYISRLMAEGMNGKLYLQSSKPGAGSTFVLELPLAAQQPADPNTPPHPSVQVEMSTGAADAQKAPDAG